MRMAILLRAAAVIAAGVLALAAIAPAHAQKMGAFHVCYASKAMPGAVVMALNLVVVTPKKTMLGEVTVSQAVNPPLHVMLPVSGHYRNVKKGRHVAELASPKMPGGHISIVMTATANWKAAVATYSLWLDTPRPPKKGKLSQRQTACK